MNMFIYIYIYSKLLHENITKTYKKTNKNRINAINKTAKKIASDL